MKLRFEVNQAEAFRQGIDCPKSIIWIEVNPAKLTQEERDLIADRMDGIDLYSHHLRYRYQSGIGLEAPQTRIVAKSATFEGLMAAIKEDESMKLPNAIAREVDLLKRDILKPASTSAPGGCEGKESIKS